MKQQDIDGTWQQTEAVKTFENQSKRTHAVVRRSRKPHGALFRQCRKALRSWDRTIPPRIIGRCGRGADGGMLSNVGAGTAVWCPSTVRFQGSDEVTSSRALLNRESYTPLTGTLTDDVWLTVGCSRFTIVCDLLEISSIGVKVRSIRTVRTLFFDVWQLSLRFGKLS